MCSAKINRYLVINVNPNIIATANAKLEPLLEAEFCMRFEAEMLVTATITLTAFFGLPTRATRSSRSFSAINKECPTTRSLIWAAPTKDAISYTKL